MTAPFRSLGAAGSEGLGSERGADRVRSTIRGLSPERGADR